MIEFFTSNFSFIHAREKFCVCSASERATSTPEIREKGILTNLDPTKAIAQNVNSITTEPDLTSYSATALPKEKVCSTLTGQVKQGTRGRGRGRKALWKENDALLKGKEQPEWLLRGGGDGKLGGSLVHLDQDRQPAVHSPRGRGKGILCASVDTASMKTPQTPTRKSPCRESSPGTSLGSNTAEAQLINSKKDRHP
jgi:hypothetical protein